MNDVTTWFSAVLVGGMLLISLGLWTYVIRRHRSGQLHFFSARERLKLPLGLVDVLLAFIIWMTGQMIGLAITFAIMGIDEISPTSMSPAENTVLGYAVGTCIVVSTVLTLAYLYARYQNPEVFGGSLKYFGSDIGLGCLVFMCFVPISGGVDSGLGIRASDAGLNFPRFVLVNDSFGVVDGCSGGTHLGRDFLSRNSSGLAVEIVRQ